MLPEPTAGLAEATDAKSPVALLLRGSASADDERLVAVLDFFGIPWVALTISQATAGDVGSVIAGLSTFSVLTSASTLAEILRSGGAAVLPDWMTGSSAIFVYGFRSTDVCRNLLRIITADPEADIRNLNARSPLLSISSDLPEICGPMSGLQVPLLPGAAHAALAVKSTSPDLKSIVAVSEGHLFARTAVGKVPFFLDASDSIVDIHRQAAVYFDVKNCFAGCIAGLNEILRRQGLLAGRWCIDPAEDLSPGQLEEIDRILASYPQLTDDDFVRANLDRWLR